MTGCDCKPGLFFFLFFDFFFVFLLVFPLFVRHPLGTGEIAKKPQPSRQSVSQPASLKLSRHTNTSRCMFLDARWGGPGFSERGGKGRVAKTGRRREKGKEKRKSKRKRERKRKTEKRDNAQTDGKCRALFGYYLFFLPIVISFYIFPFFFSF
ncbi:hypothetical protein B0T24DRAFT_408953 [Lasiosphaeria ovina]|uniref:Transmembrane protein n=1 Tax=Lasiosphaeria ovina TaxID=92902 RepID=A0AAE0N0A9_9PEZI|nr:hypothetical protein B0T24DRAFT_408953 [Lasiosphaeria ovina]